MPARILCALALTAALAARAAAEMPFPPNPRPCGGAEVDTPCIDALDYGAYLFLPAAEPPMLPNDYPAGDDAWKLTSETTGEAAIDASVQELYGVKGASVDRAWQTTTGRPDVVIAVLDSGIRWGEPLPDLVGKFYLNRGELPVPEGSTNERDPHDRNGDGFFTVPDYLAGGGLLQDARVSDQNGNGLIDPEDLIFLFSDGSDADGNGYVDDISGWDFFEDDNDPLDEVRYGHGTGESNDSGAEANNGTGGVGVCPNCLLLEVRVGDSFVTDVNLFAQGVLFAVDSGARVVQEALGTLNQTAFGQQAVDYAWRNGALVVASAADEASSHHNYPANYNHTLEVNSVSRFFSQAGIVQRPRSYLYLNGCTNYGGHIHLSVPSSSCSSEATGLSAGMAGLVVSAAENAVAAGTLTRYRRDDGTEAPFALAAEEVRQLLIATADDVNFDARADVDPPLPRNYATTLSVPGVRRSERYASVAGWDQFFGYGRVNARRAVERAATGDIPPEAALESPAWFEVLDPGPVGAMRTVEIHGRAAANRADSFQYTVAVAPGVQPADDAFVEVASGQGTAAVEQTLARLDLEALRARMPHGVEGAATHDAGGPDADRFSFTVRLRVTDDRGRVGEDRRTLALHHDPDLFREFAGAGGARKIASDGVSAPLTADIDGDGIEEILFGTSAGEVQALRVAVTRGGPQKPRPILQSLEGWPVTSRPLELHTSSSAFASGGVALPVAAAVLGPIAAGDLDGDGWLEVVAADMRGLVYVWNHDGGLRPGFPVRTLPQYSYSHRSERDPATEEGRVPDRTNRRDRDNSVARGIVGGVSLGNLDGSADGSLEIVAAGLDRHVYAWRHDGSPLPGWPVLVKDPAKVESVDPETAEVRLRADADAAEGSKLVAAPSLADIDGDGSLDVVVVTNETYREPTNAVYTNLFVSIFISQGVIEPGNTRVYAIHAEGAARGGSGLERGWNPQAFLAGWPVKTSLLVPELLPFVGEGSNGPAAIADVDGDGRPEIATFSAVGPAYLFRGDGTPFLGTHPAGAARTFDTDAFGAAAQSDDTPTFAALGAPVLAELGGPGEGFQLLAPGSGLGKFLDNQLPARQLPADNQLLAWAAGGARAGKMEAAFPRLMNDLQFFAAPAVADIDGDGRPEAIQGSGLYDLHAFDIDGDEPAGWPKFTGGWHTGSPAVGDVDGDGLLEVVALTREGHLFLWETEGDACGPVLWRRWHRDEWGTGNYAADTRPPGPLGVDPAAAPILQPTGGAVRALRLPGDDLHCGEAARYEVRWSAEAIESSAGFERAEPAEHTSLIAGDDGDFVVFDDARLAGRSVHLAFRAEDEAGNRSRVVSLGAASFPDLPTPTPLPTAPPPPPSSSGCAAGGAGSVAWLLLPMLLLPRRRPGGNLRHGPGVARGVGRAARAEPHTSTRSGNGEAPR